MAKKKQNKTPQKETNHEEQVRKLMEKHPYETMSQVQNRYGDGREQNGSAGPGLDPNRVYR